METRLRHSDVSTPDRRGRRSPHSPVLKHSVRLAGNKTSISLENQFWYCLRDIARSENIPVDALIERIDTDRTRHNLSSAVRLFVLEYFRMRTNRGSSAGADLTARWTDPVL
jgi:predicted DNA-binding ribbon-helix-helix protein